MKKYQYVNVKNAGFFTAEFYDHRDIIDEKAKEGYSYVGFIPTKIECYGRIIEYDLVFEIEE